MLAVSFAMTADAMLKPRPGGRYLTEQQIEGWTRQGDMLMPPNAPGQPRLDET
jgi:hypothetical protein